MDAVPDIVHDYLEQARRDDTLELPMLPSVVWEVVELCASANADAQRVADLLHRDQALAANVLKFANSPMSGSSERVVSLQQAVSRLGMRTLSEMALAAAVQSELFDGTRRQSLVREMWDHALATALFAKEVARQRRDNVETAFLCGLLHDLGRPVVLRAIERLEDEIERRLEDSVVDAALDAFHEDYGGTIAESWQLPAAVADAVRHHHEPAAASEALTEATITRLADLLSNFALRGSVDATSVRDDPAVIELNLYEAELDALFAAADSICATLEAM